MTQKHTPVPYALDDLDGVNSLVAYRENGESFTLAVLSDLTKDDASFIVRACNSHEELLEACKRAINFLTDLDLKHGTTDREVKLLQDAIANAEDK